MLNWGFIYLNKVPSRDCGATRNLLDEDNY